MAEIPTHSATVALGLRAGVFVTALRHGFNLAGAGKRRDLHRGSLVPIRFGAPDTAPKRLVHFVLG